MRWFIAHEDTLGAPMPLAVATIAELEAAHEGLLLDAYGVLVDSHGALPGARELVARLNARGTPYLVLTNDASRLPATQAARFAGLALDVPVERILSSGDLLAPYFSAHGLRGARCVALGTPDSRALVERAGGVLVEPSVREPADALVVCDEAGFDLLPTMDRVVSMLFASLDAGRAPALILPNPDVLYPKPAREFGFAAGSLALWLEAALALRYASDERPAFVKLGKPHAPIFDAACARLGTRRLVMIGDQLHTDVRGALDAGLPCALALTGVTPREHAERSSVRPTWLLEGLG